MKLACLSKSLREIRKILTLFLILFSMLFSFWLFYKKSETGNSYLFKDASKLEDSKVLNSYNLRAVELKKVIDGDTVELGDGRKVRMLGIDAPETEHSPRAKHRGTADCFAKESTDYLKKLLSSKKLYLYLEPSKNSHDKYGRVLAYIFVKDGAQFQNANLEMIESGYAYEYSYKGEPYLFQREFKEAQSLAKENKLGLWADDACLK